MRKVVRAVFDNPQELSAEDVAKSETLKELLKTQVPHSINDALMQNKIYASVFEINDSSVYIDIHKSHWIGALETCLLWYIDKEDYEMCIFIKDLIKTIQNKGKGKLTINDDKDGEGF